MVFERVYVNPFFLYFLALKVSPNVLVLTVRFIELDFENTAPPFLYFELPEFDLLV